MTRGELEGVELGLVHVREHAEAIQLGVGSLGGAAGRRRFLPHPAAAPRHALVAIGYGEVAVPDVKSH